MTYNVKINPAGIIYKALKNKTILDGALENKLFLEYSCKKGNCNLCEASLLSGSVKNEHGEVISSGKFLTCSSYAETNISLNASYCPELANIESMTLPCKVDKLAIKADDIAILTLRIPPTSAFNYLPGQYIDLSYQGVKRSYSLANIKENSLIELHIRLLPNGEFSQLLKNISLNQLMRIEGPKGTFFIRETTNPIILLAGGTGFAPIKAMAEGLISAGSSREIFIYWGMTEAKRFYTDVASNWAKEFKNIKYIPVVSGNDESWKGRFGLVHEAVLEDFSSLSRYEVYACGSPNLIDKAKELFLQEGLNPDNFYADAFVPSN
ncbi:FAD-binding oxidoreductase [Legionella drancourtii]|uniref:CDP-6-deoxy-delta-3,4-glucoseen reductase n=1 Tax=Legionella drancourtii LLAP12 TaxID=658187 RepID=G9ENC0_9GAMM|nr:FAD-binding oxidoreductase [Legionella drancourtii]EHL31281.1 hypothetical protein LDG_6742 [Legionella drancourtii LLAP12]